MTEASIAQARARTSYWPAILAGMCATVVSNGLLRFAYGPILPALVRENWLPEGQAGALGGINLLGYLAGASVAGMAARRFGMRGALRLGMFLGLATLAACAWNGGFAWFLLWRILAGFAGGILMVLAGPAVQAVVPAYRRGLASGLVISGIGFGIMVGAVLVPAVLAWSGLPATWLGLAATTALLAAIAWPIWPNVPAPPPSSHPDSALPPAAIRMLARYTLAALAATAHLIFWPDYIARGLGQGIDAGAFWWLVLGAGTCVGGILLGGLADRIGAAQAIRVALAIQSLGVGIPLLSHTTAALALSSLCGGVTCVGLTVLCMVRARIFGAQAGARVWGLATIVWGAAMATGGFAMTGLLVATGSHLPIFALALAASLTSLALELREHADS